MYVYLNGEIVRKEDAAISPYDHGFLYGIGLFETFRIYDGFAFLLKDHLERLHKGLAELQIEKTFHLEKIKADLTLLLEKNEFRNAYVRFNVSAGMGELGLTTDPYSEPNVIIFAKPLAPAGNDLFEKRAKLLNLRRNTPEGSYRLKSHHFLNNVMAKRELGNSTDVEGIFLTENGHLAEGVVSNLFWVKNGTIYTPTIDTGILNGITRQFVIKLAESHGLKVNDGYYQPEVLDEADEIFITNSIQELVAIHEWNGTIYPGAQGEVTQFLSKQYQLLRTKLESRFEL
jgi:4-amino-4-deoxychorismate lyase